MPRAYIFRRAFLRGLFLEGLIFGARGLSMEGNCVSKWIGQLYSWKEIYPFCFVLLCIWGQFPSTSPQEGGLGGGGGGGLYLMGQLEEWFTMVLFLSLTQVITRLVFSASPLIYWYAAYVIISDSTEPPYRHCRSKWKSQLILGYFLLYFFIGTALHCNFYPWTW